MGDSVRSKHVNQGGQIASNGFGSCLADVTGFRAEPCELPAALS